jgi:hypothetical protein
VRRLVRPELLRLFAGAQSGRAGERRAASFKGRVVAASDQSEPLRRAVQHSTFVSIRGLRISSCKSVVVSYQ